MSSWREVCRSWLWAIWDLSLDRRIHKIFPEGCKHATCQGNTHLTIFWRGPIWCHCLIIANEFWLININISGGVFCCRNTNPRFKNKRPIYVEWSLNWRWLGAFSSHSTNKTQLYLEVWCRSNFQPLIFQIGANENLCFLVVFKVGNTDISAGYMVEARVTFKQGAAGQFLVY